MIFSPTTLRLVRKVALACMVLAVVFVGGKAVASSGDNATGYAWSANIGWISFNCTSQPGGCVGGDAPEDLGGIGGGVPGPGDEEDTGVGGDTGFNTLDFRSPFAFFHSAKQVLSRVLFNTFTAVPAYADVDHGGVNFSSYGVSVDPLTGNFSGYAWSSNIGWISFNEYTDCPDGSCTPHLAIDTGKISGWAKAIAATGTSGWDGWISLSCHNSNLFCTGILGVTSPEYGLTYSSATDIISGYAWGGDVVGWISFDGPTYEVIVDLDQPIVTLTSDSATFCPGTTTTLTWNAVGDAVTCNASSSNADPAFNGPIAASGTAIVSPSAPSTTYTISCTVPGSDASYQQSVTVALGDCGSELILSAESAPAQCTAGYLTDFTLYSPTSTSYSSCTALVPTPTGTATVFASTPNGGNGYLVTIPDVLVASNPTNFTVSCTEEISGAVNIATTSVARACAAPYCEFTSSSVSGSPLKADFSWTSTGASGPGLSASRTPLGTGWSGKKSFNSSVTDVPFTAPQTTYFLKAINPDGLEYTCKAVLDSENWCDTHPDDPDCITDEPVCIDPNPDDPNGMDCDTIATVTLTADPETLGVGGGETTLVWNTTNVVTGSCKAFSFPFPGADATWDGGITSDNGTDSVSITSSYTFKVECKDGFDPGNLVEDYATVDVEGTVLPCDNDPLTPNPDCPCTDPVACPTVRTKPWYIER